MCVQDLRKVEDSFEDPMLVSTPAGASAGAAAAGAGGGRLAALLTIDYYNRTLSGWEPVVEPWRYIIYTSFCDVTRIKDTKQN